MNAAPPNAPQPRSPGRRRFLRTLLGLGAVATVGTGADLLLARTRCRAGEWHGPVSDHFDGTHFFNPPEEDLPPADYGSSPIWRWLRERVCRVPYPVLKRNAHHPELAPVVDGRDWEVTMVNHSTMLIRMAGLCILTDPVWSDYTSPIQGVGPVRTRPPGIPWNELPHVDVCLLSHDHYDHFDVNTLRCLEERFHPLFVLPLGLRSLLEYHLGHPLRVEEKDWWDSVLLPGLRITLTPARHWSKRYRHADEANRSLWCGFWLQATDGPKVYFAGDTARTGWFARIYAKLGAPDVALLPIGAYKPDWIRAHHTNPPEAVQAMLALHAPRAIACHFGTWQLANESYEETLRDLAAARSAAGLPEAAFIAPDNGRTLRGTASPECK